MAITAHWIEGKTIQTPEGPRIQMTMWTDLIGFQRLPGRHTGKHLANAFLHVTDRIGITEFLGHITLDNASNNNTFCDHLSRLLNYRNIHWSWDGNQIRCVTGSLVFSSTNLIMLRCFPHIMNLAVKEVLKAITNIELAKENAADFQREQPTPSTANLATTLSHDPISTLRSLIRTVC